MQGQLGVNKKNPLIHLVTSEDEKVLYVWLGILYYTCVPNDPASVQYRLLVGQLALADFSIAALMRAFDLSRPTIYRYRDIVDTSQDEAELFARLRGGHCDKTKMTPEVEAFIKARFRRIYPTNRGTYNQQLRREVAEEYGLKLSAEAVRQVIAPLRQELDSGRAETAAETPTAQTEAAVAIPQAAAESAAAAEAPSALAVNAVAESSTISAAEGAKPQTEIASQPAVKPQTASAADVFQPVVKPQTTTATAANITPTAKPQATATTTTPTATAANIMPRVDATAGAPSQPDSAPTGRFFLHAGLLALNLWLVTFAAAFQERGRHLLQWLYQVLAGAVNFEQSRFLSQSELGIFIGSPVARVSKSRELLEDMAHNKLADSLEAFLKFNLAFVARQPDRATYFYLDGHFDPYYGEVDILSGWACLFNRAMKGSQHYVIHDSQGFPFLKEVKDCFQDFRDYLRQVTPKLKAALPGQAFGLVFDRGAFSQKLFRDLTHDGVYFITWQKGFDMAAEPALDFNSPVVIEREINQVGHVRRIEIDCAETVFHYSDAEGGSCRKIIIRARPQPAEESPVVEATITPSPTDALGAKTSLTTEASITKDASGLAAASAAIARVDEPFYAAILTNDPTATHQQIVEAMTNRWRCQENDFRYEKKHFGLDQITSYDTLPAESLSESIEALKGQERALQKDLADARARRQEIYADLGIKKLTAKTIHAIEADAGQPQRQELVKKLCALKPQLAELSVQINQLNQKIERLTRIDQKGYLRLDYRKKLIFDHVRFSARNIFYTAIARFKDHYPNLRDVHVVFWKLIRASGFVRFDKTTVTVTLICPFFEGRTLQAVENFLQTLNDSEPILLDGSGRKIRFDVNAIVAN